MIAAAQQEDTAENVAAPCAVTVTPAERLSRALDLMFEHGQSHVPVVQGDDVHGLLSEKVLVSMAAVGSIDMELLTAADALSGPAAQVAHDTPISATIDLVLEGELDALVVRRHGRVIGVITVTALLRRMSDAAGLSALRAAPAEVRQRVLVQHDRIRGLLDHLEEQAGRLANGEPGVSLELAARMLTPVLLTHLEHKERRLLPALRRADGSVSARADDLEREHTHQRELLRRLHGRLAGSPEDTDAAMIALELVRAVRDDMVFEESEYLWSGAELD